MGAFACSSRKTPSTGKIAKDNNTLAAFTNVDYKFTNHLAAQAGVRFTQNNLVGDSCNTDQNANGQSTPAGQNVDLTFGAPPGYPVPDLQTLLRSTAPHVTVNPGQCWTFLVNPQRTTYPVVPGYWVGSSDGRWRVTAYGRNVTNKFYLTTIFEGTDTLFRYAGMPATYRVSVRVRF